MTFIRYLKVELTPVLYARGLETHRLMRVTVDTQDGRNYSLENLLRTDDMHSHWDYFWELMGRQLKQEILRGQEPE